MSSFAENKLKMSEEIPIHITGMVYNQSLGGTYSLVLAEDEGQQRRFSVLIGESEAQSIALKLNNTIPPRPLSHDLMQSLITMLNARLIKVVIYNMKNDIFYSNIYLMQGSSVVVLDARTSDAVALAVRSEAPIYINAEILDEVGTVLDAETATRIQPKPQQKRTITLQDFPSADHDNISNDELQELLDKAIEEEEYEIAVQIRNVMAGRK